MAKGTVNKVTLIGRLGADPEIKYTSSGTSVANFNIATNEVWKDKEGNTQERTEWHRIVAWQKPAEIISQYLKKGSRVYLEGKLQTRDWEDKDGIKRYTTEVVVDKVEFLESSDSGNRQQKSSNKSDKDRKNDLETTPKDDLPF